MDVLAFYIYLVNSLKQQIYRIFIFIQFIRLKFNKYVITQDLVSE